MMAVAFDIAKPANSPRRIVRLSCLVLTTLILYLGFNTFNTLWAPSSKVAALSSALGMSTPIFLLAVSSIGCIVGAYAVYVLACWIIIWSTKLMRDRLPVQEKTSIIRNLKQNWCFPVSAMAFFCLYLSPSVDYLVGLIIALVASLITSSQIQSILSYSQNSNRYIKNVSFLTAIGICLAGRGFFDKIWSASSKVQTLESLFPITIDLPMAIGTLGSVVALYFVYYCMLVFWNSITKIISESKVFNGITVIEWAAYGILLGAVLVFAFFSFSQSEAFYGTELLYDVIYTSDSPDLVKGNVYLTLTHRENDLRQPLFAVFSAPFTGVPFLAAQLIGASPRIQAILMNSAQILMLFAANFMLAKMLKLDSVKRICFMVMTSCTYTHMLFAVMMEQYIVAYFWLAFCMYLIAEKQRPDRIVLWGAGGTLLTSMILLPFMSTKSPIKDFKSWFMDMVKYGLEFVALMLVFCRFDVIFNLMSRISFLSGFTGKTVTFADKIHQYTEFIGNCFIAPNAGVNTTSVDHISWQLNPATGISFAGILILILAVISAIWNRDKKSSLLAAGWVGFSVIMLLGLGWGTKENGLILYALYFGWAFLVLLFQLAEKIESKLNIKFLVLVVTIVVVVALLVVNIPAIMEMVDFAITYYPV